jgi:cytochrome c oxidase assembly protein subunit 15
MAELHSSLVLLLVGLTIGLVVGLHMAEVPERVRKASRMLVSVMVAQAVVGYTQYFTHLPALLVEVHLIGVTALVVSAVHCFLTCTFHPAEVAALAEEPETLGPARAPVGAH